MLARHPCTLDVPLESKVAFLRQAASFAEPTYRVEAIETHMSWVFLTDQHAYKLKKPVHHDWFDFRDVRSRQHYCNEELRLNRRLAEHVYIGIVALTVDAQGHLRLDGQGTVIDWLVKMRRLPATHMLDYALQRGTVTADDMRRVAARLTAFYQGCAPVAIDPHAYREGFRRSIDRNESVLSRTEYGLPLHAVRELCAAQRTMLDARKEWFDARVRDGKIVEGHGDLRPEHVCLVPDVVVIDCLEFSRELRITDPVDELGFLALECERLGAAQAGTQLLCSYSELSGDRPNAALVHFYQSYRACLRSMIAITHLDEEKFRYSPQWRRRAGEYLQLAQRHQSSISSTSDPPL